MVSEPPIKRTREHLKSAFSCGAIIRHILNVFFPVGQKVEAIGRELQITCFQLCFHNSFQFQGLFLKYFQFLKTRALSMKVKQQVNFVLTKVQL